MVDERPEYPRFFRHTWIPDELFVPTLVASLAGGDSAVNEALHYTRWHDPGGPHPAVLRSDELPALMLGASGPCDVGGRARRKLFARKFDCAVDEAILDAIDAELLGWSASG